MQTRIQPHLQQQAQRARRRAMALSFRRRQAVGLVLLALAALVYRLFHTHPGWILPKGWWRLW